MIKWMNEWINKWINEWMNEWICTTLIPDTHSLPGFDRSEC